MYRFLLSILFCFINFLCYADYSDRGRPSDYQDHHDGPLTYIFMGVGVLILLAFAGFWIYDKITTHKQAISDALGTIFAVGLIFGGILLVAKCGESVHKSINNKSNSTEQVQHTTNPAIPSSSQPSTNQHNNQPYSRPEHTPTLRYRTVEYYDACNYCHGSGRVICSQCNGTGWVKKICSWCHGSGGHNRSRCMYCGGKGYTVDEVFGSGRHDCFYCNSTGYVENSCTRCSGSGYESEICDIYAASGQERHYVTCTYCNGSGQVRKTRQEPYYE